ncbi:MAG: DUF1294 domain-containing protein [Nocardioidaceae bacterium]
MREHGVVVEWNDARGFGFIKPVGGHAKYFAHISAFPAGHRPAVNDEVTYVATRDQRNRLRATEVEFVEMPVFTRIDTPLRNAIIVVGAFAALLVVLVVIGLLHWLALVTYTATGVISYVLYSRDKEAAERGRRRTAEADLHLIDLLGGWPGGLLAQRAFRHKTQKTSFRIAYLATVVLNIAVLVALVVF